MAATHYRKALAVDTMPAFPDAAYPDDEETRQTIEAWFAPVAHDEQCSWSAESFFASLPLGAVLAAAMGRDLTGLQDLGSLPDAEGRSAVLAKLREANALDTIVALVWPALEKLAKTGHNVRASLRGYVMPKAKRPKPKAAGVTVTAHGQVQGSRGVRVRVGVCTLYF